MTDAKPSSDGTTEVENAWPQHNGAYECSQSWSFTVNGLAVAGGPLVGGAITQGIDWPWIFWLNVPIGLALIPLVLARVPESRGPNLGVDLPGLALSAVQCSASSGALVRGNTAGWASAEVLGALIGGLGLLCAFVGWELRTAAPMLPMRLFRLRAFSADNAAIFGAVGSLFCAVFFVSQFLQAGLGYGPLVAGLRLLPWTATLFFVAPVAGKLVDRFGERPFLVAIPAASGSGDGMDRSHRQHLHGLRPDDPAAHRQLGGVLICGGRTSTDRSRRCCEGRVA